MSARKHRVRTTPPQENIPVENYLGNGEYVTLWVGIETREQKFSGAIPMGLSQYGAAFDNGKFGSALDLNTLSKPPTAEANSSYKKGSNGPQYPDECWVAIFKTKDLTTPIHLQKPIKSAIPLRTFQITILPNDMVG